MERDQGGKKSKRLKENVLERVDDRRRACLGETKKKRIKW